MRISYLATEYGRYQDIRRLESEWEQYHAQWSTLQRRILPRIATGHIDTYRLVAGREFAEGAQRASQLVKDTEHVQQMIFALGMMTSVLERRADTVRRAEEAAGLVQPVIARASATGRLAAGPAGRLIHDSAASPWTSRRGWRGARGSATASTTRPSPTCAGASWAPGSSDSTPSCC